MLSTLAQTQGTLISSGTNYSSQIVHYKWLSWGHKIADTTTIAFDSNPYIKQTGLIKHMNHTL